MSDQSRMARSSSVTPIEILLVEDSPSDIDLTREALEDTRVHNNLSVVTEGPGDPDGINFTPVRSGEEKLRLEYRPIAGGTAQRTVDYTVKVPNDSAFWFRRFSMALP